MTISFPVSLPTLDEKHSAVVWKQINNVSVSESPFSKSRDIYEWSGSRWGLEVSVDNLTRQDAMKWIAFLSSLRGQRGTFYYGDVLTAISQGTPGGTARVKGAGQTGFDLDTDGWSTSTLVLKAGDRVQIDNSLYMITADATTDGSGNVTLDLWPELKTHADNAIITYQDAKGLFALDSNEIVEPQSRLSLWTIEFSAIEAL